ncbi:hypothetical protein Dda_3879 [Drechslerella dactyloides]|uniref:Initiation-specific alpha-1,6-mannosyltransferase n=1 Tax=Drechslerella dactyloides TaxID=74499 RepID=A0AAD6J327_DREDA|nr:hypothetical protein Dda_3879 [Drechslerella dactyloides]
MIRVSRRSRGEIALIALVALVVLGILDRWIMGPTITLREYQEAAYANEYQPDLDTYSILNPIPRKDRLDEAANSTSENEPHPSSKTSSIRKISMSQEGFTRNITNHALIRGTQIPKRIWQKWKNRIDARNIWMQEGYIRDGWFTWRSFNPNYEYSILSDADAEAFVRKEYAYRPDIVKVFVELQQRIISFDLLRYLVIYRHGGVYNDMDTQCRVPIDDWFKKFNNYGIAIGTEAALRHDGEHDIQWQLDFYQLTGRIQFLQWTVMARPGHPAINRTIEALISRIYEDTEEDGVRTYEIGDLFYESGEILNLSGPGLYTREVRGYINDIEQRIVDDDEIANITDIKQYGDVLLLPVNKWAPEQSHSDAGKESTALLRHFWKGTWR